MLVSITIILLLPLIIGLGLFIKANPLIEQKSLVELIGSTTWLPYEKEYGFLSFILGSLYITIIAFSLSVPVCLLAAIYLTQFSSRQFMRFMHPVIDMLAGLPSVIYGVWGIIIIVPFISNYAAPFFGIKSSGYSILAGGIVLALMCIPYILNMLIDVFNTIPSGLKEASLSLGATVWETIKFVVIKRGISGIISAFGLGIAKAFGETMAVMMVVGNMVQPRFQLFDASYPLPALIANNYGEMLSIPMYDSAMMFAALLLFGIILFINLIFRYFIYRSKKNV
jgi:phosphate transport system permease protein